MKKDKCPVCQTPCEVRELPNLWGEKAPAILCPVCGSLSVYENGEWRVTIKSANHEE